MINKTARCSVSTSSSRNENLTDHIYLLGRRAKQAFSLAGSSTSQQRVQALHALASQLEDDRSAILAENAKDMRLASSKRLAAQLLDRLELNPERFAAMAAGVRQVANLPDPVGSIAAIKPMPSGIRVGKMRVPLGVIVMIYESRPNVTIDAAALNIRIGNALILRGGSESFNTNMALYASLKKALVTANLPAELVQLVEHTSRDAVGTLVSMSDYVDLVIPRGSRELIERVVHFSRVSVLKHLDGNCHIFVDENADLSMAKRLVLNAKTRRYGVCNALESLLVAKPVAEAFFATGFAKELMDIGVCLHLCANAMALVQGKLVKPATEQDWSTEYLGPDLSIKILPGVEEAIAHINHYGSHHTDAIVTDNIQHADSFLRRVDSSSVMVNASTSFADGFEYGLGAEIGISTDKFHARGPVGLEGLTSEKYIVLGQGEIRP